MPILDLAEIAEEQNDAKSSEKQNKKSGPGIEAGSSAGEIALVDGLAGPTPDIETVGIDARLPEPELLPTLDTTRPVALAALVDVDPREDGELGVLRDPGLVAGRHVARDPQIGRRDAGHRVLLVQLSGDKLEHRCRERGRVRLVEGAHDREGAGAGGAVRRAAVAQVRDDRLGVHLDGVAGLGEGVVAAGHPALGLAVAAEGVALAVRAALGQRRRHAQRAGG